MKYTKAEVDQLLTLVERATTPAFKVPLSARLIANMRTALSDANMLPTHLAVGKQAWSIMTSDSSFIQLLDPTSTVEAVEVGYVASLFGLDVLTNDTVGDEVVAVLSSHGNTKFTQDQDPEICRALAVLIC